ncbi:ornithine decarboxylase-like [Limulus polyphemus]|uniref:ornithine decarboxylase n=1 Tax=Limulus polyphemus TaxID=6850 RepID=A0ABM1BK40_LIMPO|nr:ornithine decarboxylase-like [Limulus polyphemus]
MKPRTNQQIRRTATNKSILEYVKNITDQMDSEEPFYVFDMSDIVHKYKMWKYKMPRVRPFYAVKCNDNPLLLELLAVLGLNFDCANKKEIQSVLGIGVDASRIIYGNPCKTRSFIKHAAAVGIDLLTFDNESELYKIKALHPAAQLVLRIYVENSGFVCQLGTKFGCDPKSAEHLLYVAQELGLDVVGVSFHVGSNCMDKTKYGKAIQCARQVFDRAISMNFNMTLLDIGGGFPGSAEENVDFDEIACVVNEALEEYFPLDVGVDVIAEPGRYFTTSAFSLCANIIAKREAVAPHDGDPLITYYLNDGVYGSFSCLMFDQAEIKPLHLMDSADYAEVCCSLWGPTCDKLDQIVKKCSLPVLTVGDWLMFENMGAYNMTLASNFDNFQKLSVKTILSIGTCEFLRELPGWWHLAQALEANIEHVQVEKDGKLHDALNFNVLQQFSVKDLVTA